MYPFLPEFTVFGATIKLPMYGIMLAIAFTAGYFEALRRAAKLGENPRHVENLFILCVFGGALGARLFHVFFEEAGYYFRNPGKIIAVWEGGYTLYGGIIACIVVITVYCRMKKISFFQYLDIAAPTTMLGLFFGRLGCLLAGCCWGIASDVPWAVTFTHPESFSSVRGVPLHPTQVYEAVAGLMVFGYLTWLFRDRKYTGQIFLHGLIAYSIMRFLIEYFRGDEYRGYIIQGWISYSQFVGVLLIIAAGFAIRHFRKA